MQPADIVFQYRKRIVFIIESLKRSDRSCLRNIAAHAVPFRKIAGEQFFADLDKLFRIFKTGPRKIKQLGHCLKTLFPREPIPAFQAFDHIAFFINSNMLHVVHIQNQEIIGQIAFINTVGQHKNAYSRFLNQIVYEIGRLIAGKANFNG